MRRSPLLVSAILHLLVMSVLLSVPVLSPSKTPPVHEPEAIKVRHRVFLPPAERLHRIAPRSPAPAPTPPPVKDRMSLGAPSIVPAKGPLELRREDDLTNQPKGHRDAGSLLAAPPAPTQSAESTGRGSPGQPQGLRYPVGAGPEAPHGEEHPEPSIGDSLRQLDRRLSLGGGPPGLETGTGRQMGPLFFDPQGADFTASINHFKNEVYRNWVVPQSALFGYARGHVSFEFTVERDGRVSVVRMTESSGTPALDRAAQNALSSSRLLPLPADFAPPDVTMQVTFYYSEEPKDA